MSSPVRGVESLAVLPCGNKGQDVSCYCMVSWPTVAAARVFRRESIPPQIGIVKEREGGTRESKRERERQTLRDRQTEKGQGGSEEREREREREREMGEERQTDREEGRDTEKERGAGRKRDR